jgi:excisionase family DNA binding protein
VCDQKYFSIPEAAAYLHIPEGSFRRLRSRGEDPPWFMAGRAVRYRRQDIDAWAAARVADRQQRESDER